MDKFQIFANCKRFSIVSFMVIYLSIILAPLALSQSSAFNGEPSYVLEIRSNNPKLVPGQNFTFELYVSGAGDVDENKLSIDIPSFMVKKGTVDYKYLNWSGNNRNFSNNTNNPDHDPGFTVILPYRYFYEYNYTLMNFGELDNRLLEGHPGPIIVNFTVNKFSPPGDYDICTNLFYKKNGKWYKDKQTLPLHIRYWYEDDRMQYIVILATIIAIVSGIVSLLDRVRIDHEKNKTRKNRK